MSRLFRIAVISWLLLLILPERHDAVAQAQELQKNWSTLVNISNSGSVSKPVLLADSTKQLLALWGDSFNGFQYSIFLDNQWSAPKPFAVPFGRPRERLRYQFLNDPKGNVHVFWMDEGNQLFYSSMRLTSVEALSGWKVARIVSKNVNNFSVSLDENEELHVAYVIGQDTDLATAGVYYLKVTTDGKFGIPVAMDQSPYFRRPSNAPVAAGEFDPSVASLAVQSFGSGASRTVLFSWNNPVVKRLYLRRSVDGGANWGEVEEIVTPDERSSNQLPQKPAFASLDGDILLLWQNSQEAVACVQYFQSSKDGGESWTERKELLVEIDGCPEQNNIFTVPNQGTFLASIYNSLLYLAVFRNNELEPAQVQEELANFSDPVTYRNIRLQSQKMLILDNQLYLIGAGVGDFNDVWISSRQVDTIFHPEETRVVWSNPRTMVQGQNPYQNIHLLANDANLVHAVWSQPADGRKNDPGEAIYYAGWSEPGSLNPRPVLRSPEGKSDQPSTAVDTAGRVYVVWSGGKSGELFFSYSDISQASTQLDWFDPRQLTFSSLPITNPVIKIDSNETLFVAYLIPLNEQRGVFISNSQDRGETWSAPVKVFDGAERNCEMLQNLSFTISTAGSLHLAWMCSTIPGGTGPYALHYARSIDRGENWVVKIDENEKKLVWGELGGFARDNLHLIWVEDSQGVYRLRDQVSLDDGETWRPSQEIVTFEDQVGPLTIAVDPGGQVVVLATSQEASKVLLSAFYWSNGAWKAIDAKKITTGQVGLINALAAVILPDGELTVVYSSEATNTSTGSLYYSLMYISRTVEVLPALAVNPTLITPTESNSSPADAIEPTPLAEFVPSATPQPTLDLNAIKDSGNPRTSSILIYVVGAILAMVVVIFAVIVSQYKFLNK